jgi:outer membrane protein TolC
VYARQACIVAASVIGVLLNPGVLAQEVPAQEVPEGPPSEAPVPEQAPPPRVLPAPGAPTLSLSESVTLALEQNFGLLSQADAVEDARISEKTAAAAFHPRFTPRYQRGPEDAQSFSLEAFQRLPWSGATLTGAGRVAATSDAEGPASHSAGVNLTLSQPLLRGFGPNATYFSLRSSRRYRTAQERAFELARQGLAIQVAEAFYQVVKQRQLLEVARGSRARNESLKAASDARVKVGLDTKLDLLRAEVQAAQAQESEVRAETSLQTALERFRVLLGMAPGELVEPEAVTLAEDPSFELEPLETLLERAQGRRLELKIAADDVDEAERAAKLARQNLLPQLDLNVSLDQAGVGPGLSEAWRAGDGRVSVFVTTSYPLERSAAQADSARSAIALEARKRSLRQRELEVDAEVRNAVREIEGIRKSVELQRKSVDFAGQQHRLATLRYQRGLASSLDVVQAEENLVLSRTALVNLLTDLQVARVNLLRVTGAFDLGQEFAP